MIPVATPPLSSAAEAATGPHHVLLPWASALSESCQQAFAPLDALDAANKLPHLRYLLNTLRAQTWLHGDEYAMQLPHELLWAQAQGWPIDESLPIGAYLAQQNGLLTTDKATHAWGLMTPCHWHMGHDSLTMWSPEELHLSDDDSRALFDTVKPWFDSDGWGLHWVSSLQWLVSHPSLNRLPTASIDRVTGRNPDVWLASDERARPIRRLQAEVQMLWYDTPVNNARAAQGLAPINSFWLSGCGVLPKNSTAASTLVVVQDLRHTLMHEDMTAWLRAWQTVDAGPLASAAHALKQGHAVRLSLCGERHALTLSLPVQTRAWQKLLARVHRPAPLRLSTLLPSL